MQIELGAGTLLGIAVTVFLSILTILVTFVYQMSVSLDSIDTKMDSLDAKWDVTNDKLTQIDRTMNNFIFSTISGKEVSRLSSQQNFGSEESNNNFNLSEESGTVGNVTDKEFKVGDEVYEMSIDYREKVTIIEIKPFNHTSRVSKAKEEGNFSEYKATVSLPYQHFEDEIETYCQTTLDSDVDISYSSFELSIILPIVDREKVAEFREELVSIIQRRSKMAE